MDLELTIRCQNCGRVTTTTNKASRIRCWHCQKECSVPSRVHQSLSRPQLKKCSDQSFYSGNRNNKCVNSCNPTGRVSNIPVNTGSPRAVGGPGRGSGRKRALICGLSYKTSRNLKLRGTLNDAYGMHDFLSRKWGFSNANIRMLTEDGKGVFPTKKNMEEGMKWLVEGCKAGDSLVFYYSGHGINLQESSYGDEIDGLDESLCPADFATEGVIRDDYLNHVLVRPLPVGVTLHAIVDACHSGTILDLPSVYNSKQNGWLDNSPRSGAKGTSGGRAISLGACLDDQMAADTSAFSKKGMNGALTMSFIQALNNANLNLTYHQLLLTMQDTIAKSRGSRLQIMFDKFLRRYFDQDALLSSSEVFDVRNTKFEL